MKGFLEDIAAAVVDALYEYVCEMTHPKLDARRITREKTIMRMPQRNIL